MKGKVICQPQRTKCPHRYLLELLFIRVSIPTNHLKTKYHRPEGEELGTVPPHHIKSSGDDGGAAEVETGDDNSSSNGASMSQRQSHSILSQSLARTPYGLGWKR